MPQFTQFTEAQKLEYATTPGKIITFKEVQANGRSTQVAVQKFIPQVNQLVGIFGNDSKFYESSSELVNAIDWQWMEENVM